MAAAQIGKKLRKILVLTCLTPTSQENSKSSQFWVVPKSLLILILIQFLFQTGCVNAVYASTAIDKMVAYFESKRNAVNENQNNGLIMLTEDEEQLSIFLDIIPPELNPHP